MQYVELGRTGLRISRLGLGTMNFGIHANEKESFTIMDRALELGINFFDTADRYGGKDHPGRPEEILGRWLAQGSRRDRIVLATKVYSPMGPGANDRGLSAFHIRRACRASLERLRTEHIDLYQMHHVDKGYVAPVQIHDLGADVEFLNAVHLTPGAPWDEIWQAMAGLIYRDKITYVGSSNFAAWNIVQACETAKSRHLLGLVSEQSVYNLVNRHVELEVVPACRAFRLGFFCWSPLAGGLLAGAIEKENKGRRARLDVDEELRRKLKTYENLCREIGESPACVALAWLLNNPVVTAPIIGPRNLDQLDSAIRALELTLSDDVLKQIDEIFPGPGGEAPMAYAW
jgi:aryl-alcohol dehydrogenase-like predicted oxidoreductase